MRRCWKVGEKVWHYGVDVSLRTVNPTRLYRFVLHWLTYLHVDLQKSENLRDGWKEEEWNPLVDNLLAISSNVPYSPSKRVKTSAGSLTLLHAVKPAISANTEKKVDLVSDTIEFYRMKNHLLTNSCVWEKLRDGHVPFIRAHRLSRCFLEVGLKTTFLGVGGAFLDVGLGSKNPVANNGWEQVGDDCIRLKCRCHYASLSGLIQVIVYQKEKRCEQKNCHCHQCEHNWVTGGVNIFHLVWRIDFQPIRAKVRVEIGPAVLSIADWVLAKLGEVGRFDVLVVLGIVLVSTAKVSVCESKKSLSQLYFFACEER